MTGKTAGKGKVGGKGKSGGMKLPKNIDPHSRRGLQLLSETYHKEVLTEEERTILSDSEPLLEEALHLAGKRQRKKKLLGETPVSGRISYVRKPFAKDARISIFLLLAAFLFLVWSLTEGTRTQGQASLLVGACGINSIVLTFFSIGYSLFSFRDQEADPLPGRFCLILSVIILAFWFALLMLL